jgi:hypothetical protein
MLLARKSATPASWRVLRLIASAIAASAIALLPWTAYLAATLPSSASARHWSLAWCGLDLAIAGGLAATAWAAIRRDRRAGLAAASTATLLLTDAWFDVCTSPPGRPLAWAIAQAVLEVAGAVGCLVLAWAIWRDIPAGGNR